MLNSAQNTSLKGEDLELFKKTRVLIDPSGKRVNNLNELLNTFGADKFAFGTHSPILDYVTGLLRIEALRENEADEDTKALLHSGNARRLLEI